MLLTIGEIAKKTGLSTRTLRHYDTLGLLSPSARSQCAYRLYGPPELERLLQIQSLKSLGLNLSEIKQALDDPEFDPGDVLRQHIQVIEQRQAQHALLLRRLRNVQAAAKISWDEVTEIIALTERMNHPDQNVRIRAALEARSDDGQAALPVLLEQLTKEADVFAGETLTWAVVQRGSSALMPLQAHLQHPDAHVRLRMVHTLSKLADHRSVAALLPLLDDVDPQVARKVIFTLGRMNHPKALAALTARLGQYGTDLESATVLSEAVALYGGEALPWLTKALKHPEAQQRVHAAETLGRIEDERAAPDLMAALSDPVAEVRFGALLGLGALHGQDVTEAISTRLSDSDSRLQSLARRLLKDREAGPDLLRTSKGDGSAVAGFWLDEASGSCRLSWMERGEPSVSDTKPEAMELPGF